MEIFGVGTPELIAILIIMLIVAGPKRMIQWAYILGQYTAKLRKMWSEAMVYMQKELDDAGMNVELPKEIPTRATIAREITRMGEEAMSPVTTPIQDTLKDTKATVQQFKEQTTIKDSNGFRPQTPANTPPSSNGNSNFGSWSGPDKTDSDQ